MSQGVAVCNCLPKTAWPPTWTGHAEAVEVRFDPRVLSYEDLLRTFFRLHDPTTKNRQGNDRGTQYRSAIFTHGEAQKKLAEESKRALEASGQADAIRSQGTAEAEVLRLRGQAEADVVRLKGEAEAGAMTVKAAAFHQYNQAAILDKT